MKHIVRKPYWDYEKEEKWLNEMSAKGLMLTDYSWCRYVFEEGPKGEYIYRIELLPNWHSHPESMAYIRFLEESGVECVAGYMCWVYLRKKASEGPFDIYSDIDSRIRHYRRINIFWNAFTGIEIAAALLNMIAVGVAYILPGESALFPHRQCHICRPPSVYSGLVLEAGGQGPQKNQGAEEGEGHPRINRKSKPPDRGYDPAVCCGLMVQKELP